jgi:hypothetical protein
MGMIGDMVARLSGRVKVQGRRALDLEGELRPGRLLLLDSGMHQPVQYHARIMTNLGSLADKRTVEIRSWGFDSSRISHYERHDRRHRENNRKPHYPNPSGEFGIVYRKVFERDGALVDAIERYSLENRPAEKVNPVFAAELAESIEAKLKTLVSLEHCLNRDGGDMESALVESIDIGIAAVRRAAAEAREAPIFIVDVMKEDDSPAIRDALARLKEAGAAILVVYTVSSPCPMTDMPSDLHMIERYPLKTRFEDELVLATEEIVVIARMDEVWKIDRNRWIKRDDRPLQTVAEYNRIQGAAA